MPATATKQQRPPRDGLTRTRAPGLEVRAAGDDEGGMPTLFGYFLRFNEWTEIESVFEGRFMECVANGAASKTLSESRDSIRILFNHGFDPSIGEKPLTKPELAENAIGVLYEGEMFDTTYCRDLVPALEAGVLGASFRFDVVQESWNEDPGPSPHNPEGLPERMLTEIRISEGGPVTFPAYEGATAGVRSSTDRTVVEGLMRGRTAGSDALFASWVQNDPERARAILSELDESRSAVAEVEAPALTPDSQKLDEPAAVAEPAVVIEPVITTTDVPALSTGAEPAHSADGSREQAPTDAPYWRL